jgi:hypothetical protein
MRPGSPVPMLFVLQSTNEPLGRKINTIVGSGGYDTFAYKLRLTHHKGPKSELIDVASQGFVSEKEYQLAEKLYGTTSKFLGSANLSGVGETD